MIPDICPSAMGKVAASQADETAARAIRPMQPGALHNYSDADLVDELRGQRFARDRATARIDAITAELERRGLRGPVRGTLGLAMRHENPLGRVDLKRLRAERPDVAAAYALPGSDVWWSVRTLAATERGQRT